MDAARLPRQRQVPGCQHEGCPRGLDKRRAASASEAEKISPAASSNTPSYPSPRDTSCRELRAQTRQLGACASGARAWTRERAGVRDLVRQEAALRPNRRPPQRVSQPEVQISAPDSGGPVLATSRNRRARRKASSFMYARRSRILARSGLSPFSRKRGMSPLIQDQVERASPGVEVGHADEDQPRDGAIEMSVVVDVVT